MDRKILETLKEQAEAELKKIADEVGRLQYEALLRTSFIGGVNRQLESDDEAGIEAQA